MNKNLQTLYRAITNCSYLFLSTRDFVKISLNFLNEFLELSNDLKCFIHVGTLLKRVVESGRSLPHTSKFLLSEHTLYKESIVMMKKNSTLRLPHIYTFSDFLNSFMLLLRWCMCVCMWVDTTASKRCIRQNLNLVCLLQVNVGRTLLILVNVGCLVFRRSKKKKIRMHYGQ